VHAIVVTHRGASWISACLRALEAQLARAQLQIVVVDNGSSDGTAALLEREFPGVTVLRLSRNHGYGRANNVALRRALGAGADFAALVNDDVEVEAGWLQALLDAAAAHPEAGLFCGTLLFRGEERVNSTGVEIDAFGRARDRDFGVARGQVRRDDGPVTAVTGGAALLRCDLLRRIGVFDPAYFAYYEDVDLSLRAARNGAICWYVAGAVARHRFGATTGPGSAMQRFLLGRGHLRTLALHERPLRAAALLPLTAAYRVAVKVPVELFRGRPALAFAELRAAISGSASALAALPQRGRKVPRGAEP
jgi:GT2 family glycosyltransferase